MTTIGVENLDGTITFAHTSLLSRQKEKLLVRDYNSREKIHQLFLSAHPFNFLDNVITNVSSIRSFLSQAHQGGSTFNYLFKDNQWFVNDELTEGLRPLIMKGES